MATSMVSAPNADFNGVVAGVTFIDGVGETDDKWALAYFTRHGYTIEEAADLDPETVTVSTTVDTLAATKAQLVAWAAAQTPPIPTTGLTKAQIVAAINSYDDATAPAISAQPENDTVLDGAEASFTVTATGTEPLSYQWQVQLLGAGDWEDIEGADEATYTFEAAEADSTNKYRVVVSNIKGSATSNGAATLTVTTE